MKQNLFGQFVKDIVRIFLIFLSGAHIPLNQPLYLVAHGLLAGSAEMERHFIGRVPNFLDKGVVSASLLACSLFIGAPFGGGFAGGGGLWVEVSR